MSDTPAGAEGLTPAASADVDDVDAIELQAAHAAAKADGETGEKPGDGATAAAPAADAGKAGDDGKGGDKPVVPDGYVPIGRLNEELGKRSKAETDAAYWRGVAEGRQAPAGTGKDGGKADEPAKPTIEERRAEIAGKIDELAKKFDDGEITMADFKKQERELLAQEDVLREEALLTKVKPEKAPPTPPANDELYLLRLTADLEQAHPWVGVAEAVGSNADWDYVKARAIEQLVAKKIDPRQGTIGRYELRREMSEIWDEIGPSLLSTRAKAKNVALPGEKKPAAAGDGGKPLSEEAKARLAKLDQAGRSPPDLAGMRGSIGDAPGDVSATRLEAMTDDEIAELPEAVRRKHRGLTAA